MYNERDSLTSGWVKIPLKLNNQVQQYDIFLKRLITEHPEEIRFLSKLIFCRKRCEKLKAEKVLLPLGSLTEAMKQGLSNQSKADRLQTNFQAHL